MTSAKDFVEKRKHKRFKTKGNAFAVLKSDSRSLGQIKNISQGGLSFQYASDQKDFNNSKALDIFLVDDRFYLEQVPVRTVLDFKIDESISRQPSSLRQRNIQFGDMMPIQKFQLYYILQHHTTDEV